MKTITLLALASLLLVGCYRPSVERNARYVITPGVPDSMQPFAIKLDTVTGDSWILVNGASGGIQWVRLETEVAPGISN